VLGVALAGARWYVGPLPLRPGRAADAPAEHSRWPWPGAAQDAPHPGVTRWRVAASDGTVATLLRFDLRANPGLRFEIYDQDEDDDRPFDNAARFWPRGAAQAAAHLDGSGRGQVIAAWNGLFFATEGKTVGHHVGPVVLNGSVRYGGLPVHRWTFGVGQGPDGRPTFAALHKPDRATLARTFTFAADAAQCLVREGKALALRPFPAPGEPPAKQPVPSTPDEAGHIPIVDHMRTTRASMGWTRDSRTLYLLFVKEPDSETASIYAQRRGVPLAGGWTVADLQRFWLSLGVWGAVNSDGGDLAQLLTVRSNGAGYDLIPPRWSSPAMRLSLGPHLAGAPQGGSLMYWVVRDVSSKNFFLR
jgi:hypothetical protein